VAVAAPRGHGKTTAGTQTVALASVLFNFRDHVLLTSATEKLGVSLLKDIRIELTENEDLISAFSIHGLEKDNEAEIICRSGDNIFRIFAKGAEQKLRGEKWRNRRPNLILVDDLEEDEAVESPDRREKLANWVDEALIPLGSDDCLVRFAGTVLGESSYLNRTLKDSTWLSKRFSAHRSFGDFSDILWPEKFSAERLRLIRQRYINKGNPSGYSKEYLNIPIADTDAYFSRRHFLGMSGKDFTSPKKNYAAIDFAISTADRANKTAITVGGVDPAAMLHIHHNRSGRWDSPEIINQMFKVQEQYRPELFAVEKGMIEKSILPFLEKEMRARGTFLNLYPIQPSGDKRARARSFQARHNSGNVRYDLEAEWFPDMQNEMETFTGRGDQQDDTVDTLSMLGLLCDEMQAPLFEEEQEDEDLAYEEFMSRVMDTGRDAVTGY
jgi:predicted phage terminase large subunit-like protein